MLILLPLLARCRSTAVRDETRTAIWCPPRVHSQSQTLYPHHRSTPLALSRTCCSHAIHYRKHLAIPAPLSIALRSDCESNNELEAERSRGRHPEHLLTKQVGMITRCSADSLLLRSLLDLLYARNIKMDVSPPWCLSRKLAKAEERKHKTRLVLARVQKDLVGEIGLVAHVTAGPVVRDSIRKDPTRVVERGRRDRAALVLESCAWRGGRTASLG